MRFRIPLVLGAACLALTGCVPATSALPADRKIAAPIAADATETCNDKVAADASIKPASSITKPSAWKADKAIADILRREKLTVGVSGDAPLWGYSNPVSGDLTGFDVEVARQVARALGVQVEFRVLPLSGRIAALNTSVGNGGVDLVAERFSMNCARWQGVKDTSTPAINFSSAYYKAYQKLLVRADFQKAHNSLAELRNYPICAVAGSTSLGYLQEQQKQNGFRIVTAADSGQCLVKFQEGEAVAISADETTLAGFASQDQYAVVIPTELGDPQYYGLGLPTDLGFTQYVNAVLDNLRADGSLTDIYRDTMGKAVSGAAPTPPKPVYGRGIATLGRS